MPSILINPTPIPSKVDRTHSLSERVNIATRSLHTQLNRLILLRLPLALPPKTTNPSRYVSGLLYIAPIYITFESLWQTILDALCEEEEISEKLNSIWNGDNPKFEQKCDPSSQSLQPTQKMGSRIHCLLSDLHLPALPRADTLRTDIRVLTGIPEDRVQEQLSMVSKQGRLADFLSHIESSVKSNPHVLLAYAWVLYMALFSGGRHLRAELKKAGGIGPNFWGREPSPVRPYSITQERRTRLHDSKSATQDSDSTAVPGRSRPRSDNTASEMIPGMQFFHFLGTEDGEDIKRQFKACYAEAESHLTEFEKDDIVSESQHIFSFMLELISDLDLIMETQEEDLQAEPLLQEAAQPLIASRDSVSVTRERISRWKVTDTEKHEIKRKPSFLEVVTEPLAKLIQFRGAVATWDLVMKPLGRRFSKDLSLSTRQVSFPSKTKTQNGASKLIIEHYVAVLVVFASALVALLAWYNSA